MLESTRDHGRPRPGAGQHPPPPGRPSSPRTPQEPYKVDRRELTVLPPPSALPRLSIPVPWLTVRGAWRWPLGPPLTPC